MFFYRDTDSHCDKKIWPSRLNVYRIKHRPARPTSSPSVQLSSPPPPFVLPNCASATFGDNTRVHRLNRSERGKSESNFRITIVRHVWRNHFFESNRFCMCLCVRFMIGWAWIFIVLYVVIRFVVRWIIDELDPLQQKPAIHWDVNNTEEKKYTRRATYRRARSVNYSVSYRHETACNIEVRHWTVTG